MDRVPSWRFVPGIEAAVDLIPARLHGLVVCDFLCGTDPVFAGLHGFEGASYGRSYRDTAHCVFPFHQTGLAKSSRRTTIVLPDPKPPSVVVHELGHVLHESLRFEPTAIPVSAYAETDELEAFAEAFTSWLVPGYAARPGDEFLALMTGLIS